MKSFNKGKLLLIAAAILPLSILEANPGFSRQMDMECMACHNQTMSQLNSFGRKFAASGFTMASGMKSMIDGSTIKLGLPSALNASVLLKARYAKTNSDFSEHDATGKERGSLELFKVSKLFFGGKVAENVGALINLDYDNIGGKVAFAYELGSGYAGITGYSQDNFGPFSGMEYYNTGLYAPLKLFENRTGTNAAQVTELGHGPATGIQAYYGGDELYMMGGAYVPASSDHEGLDIGSSAIPIGRIAYAPTIGDWTIMVGAYGLDGSSKLSQTALDDLHLVPNTPNLIEIERRAYGFDVQVEGDIAGVSTVITLNSVLSNKTTIKDGTGTTIDELILTNNEYESGDNRAFSAEIQVNPWEAFGIKVAYLHYDDMFKYLDDPKPEEKENKFDKDSYSVGLDYSYRQNVRFAVEYTYNDSRLDGQPGMLADSDDFIVYTMIGF